MYMERKAKKGQPAHFEIVYSYDVYSKYFSQDYMLSHLKPYDKTSDVYLKYTAPDAPQILLSEDFQALANISLVGRTTR